MSSGEVRLYIDRSVISDSGLYTVQLGHVTSRINVEVISERPVFTSGLTDQPVIPGDAVTFTATVRGVPRPRIDWLVGGVEVAADKYVVRSSDDGWVVSLTLPAVTTSDVGLSCECRAASDAGQAVSVASLVPGWSLRAQFERRRPLNTRWPRKTAWDSAGLSQIKVPPCTLLDVY